METITKVTKGGIPYLGKGNGDMEKLISLFLSGPRMEEWEFQGVKAKVNSTAVGPFLRFVPGMSFNTLKEKFGGEYGTRVVQVQGQRDGRFKTFALMVFGPGYILLVGLRAKQVVSVKEAATQAFTKMPSLRFVGDTKGYDSWARRILEDIFAKKKAEREALWERRIACSVIDAAQRNGVKINDPAIATRAVREMITDEPVRQKNVRYLQQQQQHQQQQQLALQQQQQQALQQQAYMEALQQQRAYYAHLHAKACAQEQAFIQALQQQQQQPVEASMVKKAGQVVDEVKGFFGKMAEEVTTFFTSSQEVMARQL